MVTFCFLGRLDVLRRYRLPLAAGLSGLAGLAKELGDYLQVSNIGSVLQNVHLTWLDMSALSFRINIRPALQRSAADWRNIFFVTGTCIVPQHTDINMLSAVDQYGESVKQGITILSCCSGGLAGCL